jgi:hypothetical protein
MTSALVLGRNTTLITQEDWEELAELANELQFVEDFEAPTVCMSCTNEIGSVRPDSPIDCRRASRNNQPPSVE